MSTDLSHALFIGNLIFAIVFLLEMIFKLIGFGLRGYFSDRYNILDCFVVTMGIIDIALEFTYPGADDSLAVRLLQSLRILRIFKLSRVWDGFREVMSQFGQSLIDVSNFSLLLLLFIFVFSLLGMEMFAFTVFLDADGNTYMT